MSNPKKTVKKNKTSKPDVSRPGKTAPPATAKPVIVTNRPLLRDPMMVAGAAANPASSEDVLTAKKSLEHTGAPVIQPLRKSAKSKSTAKKTETEPLKAPGVEESEPLAEPLKPATADASADMNDTRHAPAAEAPEKIGKSEQTKETSVSDEPEAAEEQDKPRSENSLGERSGKTAEQSGERSEPTERQSNEKTGTVDDGGAADNQNPQQSDAEAAEQARHAAEVQKLIDSKTYELPINAVEKRKTERFLILGILLAIFLALAWVDIALDAGIIHLSGIQPVTHFFSN